MNSKRFLLLTPIIVLLGAGIFLKSTGSAGPAGGSACSPTDLSGLPMDDTYAMVDGRVLNAPKVASADLEAQHVLGVASPNERWIEVDLSEQKLRAWDGDKLFLETLVSTGLPGTPTPTGEFRIWIKLRATKMEGGEGRYYYYLPNVPYVMFLENDQVPGWRGYGLHGTYWHNDFGNRRSHGCVNLPTPIAEQIYYWASPVMPEGRYTVYADDTNPGTRVIIHE